MIFGGHLGLVPTYLGLALVFFVQPVVSGQDDALPRITAVLKNLDIDVGTITVRRKNAMEDETFSLLKRDIPITDSFGRKVLHSAVKPGQTVRLQPALTGDIEAVVIEAGVFLATVADIDIKSRTIVLGTGVVPPAKQANPFTKMAVDPAAKILLAGRPAYLREIKPGSTMKLTPSLDGRTALALELVSDPDGKHAAKLYPRIKISRLPGSRWVGILTGIDPATSQIQLTGPKTKGRPQSMPVAPDAAITVLHGQVAVQELSLDQIVGPADATVMVSPDNKQVTRILVKAPVLQAKIKAVDAERGRLTTDVDGKKRDFALPRYVKVMDKSRVRRLGELLPDAPVNLVLSLDRDDLLAIDIGRRP